MAAKGSRFFAAFQAILRPNPFLRLRGKAYDKLGLGTV
jgi:hypothetical protein